MHSACRPQHARPQPTSRSACPASAVARCWATKPRSCWTVGWKAWSSPGHDVESHALVPVESHACNHPSEQGCHPLVRNSVFPIPVFSPAPVLVLRKWSPPVTGSGWGTQPLGRGWLIPAASCVPNQPPQALSNSRRSRVASATATRLSSAS